MVSFISFISPGPPEYLVEQSPPHQLQPYEQRMTRPEELEIGPGEPDPEVEPGGHVDKLKTEWMCELGGSQMNIESEYPVSHDVSSAFISATKIHGQFG